MGHGAMIYARGRTMNQLAREQFFDPLGMPQSIYRDRHDLKISNQALGYALDDDSKRYVMNIAQWEQIGDGGLQTSIDEFQRWCVSWTFVVADGALTLAPDAKQIVLPIVGPVAPANAADAFFGGPGLLQFTRDASGVVNGIDVSVAGMKDGSSARADYPPVISGGYFSP